MNKPEGRRQLDVLGLFRTALQRPFLFAILAVSLFGMMTFAAKAITGTVMTAPLVEAKLRLELIELDNTAKDPASLVKLVSLDPDRLTDQIFAGIRLDRLAVEKDAPVIVSIVEGPEDNTVIIKLKGSDGSETTLAKINESINAFANDLNLERARQRDQVNAWARRYSVNWLGRIEEAKAAIGQSPSYSNLSSLEDLLQRETLLRLMIDATAEARNSLLTSPIDVAFQNSAIRDLDDLTSGMTRLTSVHSTLMDRNAPQLKLVKALRRAEADLAGHRKEIAVLQAGNSVLNRQAVDILAPAAVKGLGPQLMMAAGWLTALPISALLSLLAATLLAITICRIWPKPVASRAEDYLNDPNWPLPPGAHRELSN